MTIVRRIARPLLAAQFIAGGVDQIRNPASRAETARPVVAQLAGPLHLPDDPELLVRVNGAAMVGAGSMLAAGRLPRLSGLVLAATLLPTTYAGHRFWEEKDPTSRQQQKIQFLKNLGLLGGTLLASVDTEGRPGVAWRAQHAGRAARRHAEHTRRETRLAARQARREVKHAGRRAGGKVGL